MSVNREGYFVGELERECTSCGTLFKITSRTVTLCNKCNSNRVKSEIPEKRMFRRAKVRAKERGLEFSISLEDVVIPKVCPILGVELKVHKGSSGGKPESPALDRIDNDRGYVKGNVMVVSHLANMMKSSATTEQMIKFAEWVTNTHGNSAEE